MAIPRLALVAALALLLVGCASSEARQTTGTTSVATPQPAPSIQATAPLPSAAPTTAAAPTLRPPTQAPQPAATPTPSATPAPSATAIPAATATAQPLRPTRPPRPTQPPRPTPPPEPSQAVHHHVFPVRSSTAVSYGKYHHDYPATDIFCPIGSEFVAVTDGVVDYVSSQDVWDPAVDDGATRGGLSVAIIGDDGVRYYGSHLSRIADGIAPGVRVKVGQLLGLTGKTGDARNTDAHLHFGISRPTTPDDWAVRRGEVPPYDYLRAWQRDEDITPKLP